MIFVLPSRRNAIFHKNCDFARKTDRASQNLQKSMPRGTQKWPREALRGPLVVPRGAPQTIPDASRSSKMRTRNHIGQISANVFFRITFCSDLLQIFHRFLMVPNLDFRAPVEAKREFSQKLRFRTEDRPSKPKPTKIHAPRDPKVVLGSSQRTIGSP